MEPQVRMGLAALTRLAFEGQDLAPLRHQLLMEHFQNGQNAGALMDLSLVEQLTGHLDAGLDWQLKAFETCRLFQTHRKTRAKKTALVLAAPIHMGGNTPIEFLLEGSDFDIVTLYVVPGMPPERIPAHDVAFVAAPGDCAITRPLLDEIQRMTKKWPGLLNLPENIIKLERAVLPTLFEREQGVRCPKTLRCDRLVLEQAVAQDRVAEVLSGAGRFPMIIRPVGSHAGRGLEKLETAAELEIYLTYQSDEAFFVSEFVDYASPRDGIFRKYRLVFIEGRPFPCHMALSEQWKIWYMNAGMQADAAKRAEEAAFMAGFDTGFARRHADAFAVLCERVGLHYFGIDCAEDPDGNLVIFEGDNALIVHDMDPEGVFPYKKAHMRRLFAAFEAMLLAHCTPDRDAAQPKRQVAADARAV